jgi:hypothetical protein
LKFTSLILNCPSTKILVHLLANEFTYSFGGCSIIRGIEGNYLSIRGDPIPDRISVVYTDAPIALSTDFAVVAAYSRKLKEAVIEALAEEAVMISVVQVYHAL